MTDFDSRQLEQMLNVPPSTLRFYAQHSLGSESPGRGKLRKFSFGDALVLIAIRDLVKTGVSVKAATGIAKVLRAELPRLLLDETAEFYLFHKPSDDADAPDGAVDVTTTRDFAEAAELMREVPYAGFINARIAFTMAGHQLLEFQKSQAGKDG